MPGIDPLRAFVCYKPAWLRQDISSGLPVFLVALPLCSGTALASGAPLFLGLVAGMRGGIVVGLLLGSEISVSGPAAGLAVIVADAITKVGSYGVFLVARPDVGFLHDFVTRQGIATIVVVTGKRLIARFVGHHSFS